MTLVIRPEFALVGALFCVHPSIAAAQTTSASTGDTLFGWSVSGSLEALVSPDYIGSKTYRVGPRGGLQFSRSGELPIFSASDDSPGLQLIGDNTLTTGVVVGWQSSRDNDGALKGFDKIDWSIEPGLYAAWWPTAGLRLRGEVRRGFHGDEGWMADLGADAVLDDRRWLLSIGPRVHLADSKFTHTYFEVTAAEAAQSPYGVKPFGAHGSFTAVGGLVSVEYRYKKRWSVLADADYQRILGTAADSPIVAQLGSRDQFTAAIGLRYAFGRSRSAQNF